MAITPKSLTDGTQLPAVNGTLYTTPALTTAVIWACTLANTTGGAITVTLYRVPSGGTAGAPTMVLGAYSVAANTSYVVKELVNQILEPGDTIEGFASSATSVSIHISGVEYA